MASKRRRRSNNGDSGDAIDWMFTYSDMVTLLLTFFVMLFSMATIDKAKFNQLAESMKQAFFDIGIGGELFERNRGKDFMEIYDEKNSVDALVSIVNNNPVMGETDNVSESTTAGEGREYRIEDMREDIERAIVDMGLDDYVSIIEKENYYILRFNSVILFDLSSADIRESAKEVLKKVGDILSKIDNEIIMQGHTDNLPINTPQFPSNWELSTRRATNVVHFFVDNCGIDPSRITATGNAEFKPVKPNDTPENRQENRRIDIVVSKLE